MVGWVFYLLGCLFGCILLSRSRRDLWGFVYRVVLFVLLVVVLVILEICKAEEERKPWSYLEMEKSSYFGTYLR